MSIFALILRSFAGHLVGGSQPAGGEGELARTRFRQRDQLGERAGRQ
jgi:hypothetical protein